MSRIAALISDFFEDAEYQYPALAFRKAGHQIVTIGLAGGEKVTGLADQTVLIDKGVRDINFRNYNALFIPGGYAPDRLRADDNVINLVRGFVQTEKSIFVVCHGLQLLISACLLAGRRVAGRKSMAQDIANAGGILVNRKVMIDNNLITCSSEANLPFFIHACLQRLSST